MLLQYTVLLFETGMEEHGPPFLREMRERISYLTSREKLWCSADLSGKRKFILNVTQRHSHIRNYSARVFMLGDLGPTPENLRTNGLWHVEMPTCLHRRDQRTWRQCKWSRLPLGIDALGIGVSLAGQDLIAVLSAEPSSYVHMLLVAERSAVKRLTPGTGERELSRLSIYTLSNSPRE